MGKLSDDIRQGDVLLVPVEQMPAGLTADPAAAGDGRVVLAHGEVTGHAHAFYSQEYGAAKPVVQKDAKGVRYLRLVEPTALRHEEHAPPVVKDGVYKLPYQFDYSPRELQRTKD